MEDDSWIADLIHEQRLESEYCPFCYTRHHPEQPCQEEESEEGP